jgi:hypothetical protein
MLAISALITASACAGSTAGSSEGSCAKAFDFQNETYVLSEITDYTELEVIGHATEHPCHDGSGPDNAPDGNRYSAFKVRGADPDVAIAIGSDAEHTGLYAVNGDPLPADVKAAIGAG